LTINDAFVIQLIFTVHVRSKLSDENIIWMFKCL